MRDFWNSLQFKIPTVFVLSFLLVLGVIFGVFSTIGKNLLEKQAYSQVILSGQNIVSELGAQIALAESLATALANLGERLPADEALTKELVMHVMNYEGTEAFIAGGGLWPAPFMYDPKIERRSFFWGRDSQGLLQYYDDYNNPEGPGYHNEEWYVPAKHLKEGEVFWSKSYMDPYSYQPMVTVTVPMFRNGQFYGVSTVDLKLEGLHAFLEKATQALGGYAFAIDRNGKFLSYPDEALTKIYGTDDQGNVTQEFINVSDLAATRPGFESLADATKNAINQLVATTVQLGSFDEELANELARDSYQIGRNEARLIAAVLADSKTSDTKPEQASWQLFLDNDMLLGEAAFAAVFQMPRTYWKIVTVMPYSKAVEAAKDIYTKLVSSTIVAIFISLIIILFLVRRILVKPITGMSAQLQELTESSHSDNRQLKISDRGELGKLAFWFNRRSQMLYQVQSELRQAREELEQRVVERTEELREEIERRKIDQANKELRVARVEKQHSAIVELALHEPLFKGEIVKAARIINEIAAEVINVARTSIWLRDDKRIFFKAIDLYDKPSNKHIKTPPLRIASYPSYFNALQKDRSIAVVDIFNDKRTSELKEYARTYGISSLLDSPIRVGGMLRGVVCFEHAGEQRTWHDDEIRFSGEIADQFIQVLTNAERLNSEEQIRQLAFFDPLTELPNRRLLVEKIRHEIEVAKRHGVYGSLLFLDLDNFKTLNDSLGHHIGDELLVKLARRLRHTLRSEDTASRLGGDEFVVLITGESSTRKQAMEQALSVAQKIQATISDPYRLHGYDHIITSSIGITLFPETGKTAADVLKQADTAMYRSKDEGRNTISFYNPEMQKAADHRLFVEKELRTAISNREFETYFQAQVDSRGNPIGAEVLVRWCHPKKGIISPANFISIAEETGLILDIGTWVLNEACEYTTVCAIDHIAVNISPRQFRQPDFVDKVVTILKKSGADPKSLMIELTEGIVIENIDDTISKMNALKNLGIRIAIDDFGIGYSSLVYLKRFPLDQLKINQNFVRDINTDPNDAVIVETIISMAKHLGLEVVAEGVETDDQLGFLIDRGCHSFQGYFYSRPLPKGDFESYLASRRERGEHVVH